MVKRILVVDDEERYCDVVSQMLRSKGYDCEITNDPFDALQLLRDRHFEMVVSDIRMKGKDGLQLMREALEESPDLDFIIMTGYASEYDYPHIVEAGASDFITKPFTAAELEAKIGRIERERRVLSSLIETNRYLLREISLNMSIAELSKALVLSLPMDELSALVVRHAKQLTESSVGYVDYTSVDKKCLLSPDPGRSQWEDWEPSLKEAVLERLCRLWNKVVQDHKPIMTNLLQGEDDFKFRFLVTPVMANDTLLGILALGTSQRDYDEKDLVIAGRLASLYGVAIQRQCADEKLNQTLHQLLGAFEETVAALSSALETRDPYTVGHQKKVADLASRIASEMGCTNEVVDAVRLAGLVHDIGKIAVPTEILTKMTHLKEVEISLIKQHPTAGYDILKRVRFPWPIAQMVLQHHERMDGTGYPQGLSGNEILLEARILAVADVAEAMSSRRPYRDSVGIDMAIEEITKNRNSLYDSQVVDACLKILVEQGYRV